MTTTSLTTTPRTEFPMTTTTLDQTGAHAPNRDVLFALGMAAVSLAAAVSSYSGLATLADLVGWNHRLALLLPVTIDAYALTATRVWLSPKTAGHRARRWAKGNAIGAIATSVAFDRSTASASRPWALPVTGTCWPPLTPWPGPMTRAGNSGPCPGAPGTRTAPTA